MGLPFIFCASCRHFAAARTCAAFPDGIPDAILFGQQDHRLPAAGDHGIRYEYLPGTMPLPDPLPAVRTYAYLESWKEEKHPRFPVGHPRAGQFRPKVSGATLVGRRVAPRVTRKVSKRKKQLERFADSKLGPLQRSLRRGRDSLLEKLRQTGLASRPRSQEAREIADEVVYEVATETLQYLATTPLMEAAGIHLEPAEHLGLTDELETMVRTDAVNYMLYRAGEQLDKLDEPLLALHRLLAEGRAYDPDRTGEMRPIDEKELEKALVRDHGASKTLVRKAKQMGLLDSREDRRQRSKLADKLLGSADSTEDLYKDPETGQWDPERKALHDQIIDTMLREKKKVPASGIDPETGLKRQSLEWDPEGAYLKPPAGKPTLLMTAGGNAVGKSSVLFTNAKDMYPDDAIHIDFDEVKKLLPEFQQFANARDVYGTDAVHFESAAIAKRLAEEARRKGLNIVIDASGDGSGNQFERTIDRFAGSGYDVDVVMADAPLGLAVKSMIERGEGNGRYVPLPIMYRIHRNSVAQFEKWQHNPHIRHFEVYRREVAGGGPEDFKLLASGGGGDMTVAYEAMYKRMLKKARRGLTTRDIGRRD
jgi:hypothetical protein